MRTSLMLLVGLVVSWSTEAQDESSACWSSAVCYKAGYSEMEWLEIYPQPNCISKSNIPKIVEYTRIQQKFNRSIVEFFKGLGSFATKACSSCNLYEVIEVGGSGHTYSDTEECFAPVVCAVDGRTIADFVQIRPFPSCNPGKKLHETSGEMESLFNSSREYVVKELKYFLYKNCNLCQTTRMENALATLTKSLWQPSIDTTQCYAPVICDDGDNSFKNWMKFPDIDCKAAKLTLLSEKPEKIFTSILERARAEIQNIVEEECSKSCDEKSSFSTSTFEAEHTTPEILQRALASTKSDKETTSVALESMLQTSTTSESMLQTSATSLKTTLGNLVRKFENPVQSALQRVNVSKEQILSNISDFYQYTYDSSDNMEIEDGGGDMYDGGNKVYIMADGETTNNVYERYYERGDYEFSSSMGWPFTALMYINNTDGTRSNYFIQVTSNAGSDGDVSLVYFNGSLISCGVNVTYFVTQLYNASVPAICEVYFTFAAGVESEGSFKADKRSRDANNMDTKISLEGNPKNAWLGYMLLSRKAGLMIRESEVMDSVRILADAVLGCQGNLVHAFESSFQSALQRVNAKKEQIVGNIHDFHKYLYDHHTGINDGGNDMYDGGNMVYIWADGEDSTLITYERYYDRGDYEFSSSLGWPFTAVMYINNTDRVHSVYAIKVESNTGADGGGALVYFSGSLISCGVKVTYFVTQVYNASDPSICEVYYTFAAGEALEGSFKAVKRSRGTGNLDTRISLEGNPRNAWLGYTLLSRKAGMMIRESEVRESVKVFAGAVLGCQGEYCHVKNITCLNGGTCRNHGRWQDGRYYTCTCAPRYYEQRCRYNGTPTINNISSIRPKTCTSNSSVEVMWTPNSYTNGIMHRVTMKSQNTLLPHNVTMMTMSGKVLFEDLFPFTTYELQVSVCPDKCIPKLNAKRKFTTERKLPYEVQNPTADDSSSACTVTWSWTVNAGSERITYTKVTWSQRIQKENGSLTLQEVGRARVTWPIATFLIPATRSDNDFEVSLQVASCAGISKTAVASGSCRPTGTSLNTLTIALATATAVSVTAAMIFGLLLILKMRKQRPSVNTESTAVTRATSGVSSERPRNEITGPFPPPQESIYHECAGPSSPPEANLYQNSIAVQDTRGL